MCGARYVRRMCAVRWSRLTPSRCAIASIVASRPVKSDSRVACASRSRAIICLLGFSTPPQMTNRIPWPARRSLASTRSSIVPASPSNGGLQLSSRRDATAARLIEATTPCSLTTTFSTKAWTSSRISIDDKSDQASARPVAVKRADRRWTSSRSRHTKASSTPCSEAKNVRRRSRTISSMSAAGMRQPSEAFRSALLNGGDT